jgi:rhodanese-related sulfurtransferase
VDIGPETLVELLRGATPPLLLDVREPAEWAICRIEGAKLIPLGELPSRLAELDPRRETVVYCHHGPRSSRATAFLKQRGFSRALNLAGGIDGWSRAVDPDVPRY